MCSIKIRKKTKQEEANIKLEKIDEGVWSSSSTLMWSREGINAYNNLQSNAEYKKNITEKEIQFLEARAKDIRYFLPNNFTVIDLGPGDGRKSIVLMSAISKNRNVRYIGIDMSPKMIELAQERFASNQLQGEFQNADFVDKLSPIRDTINEICLVTALGLTPFSDPDKNLLLLSKIKKDDRAFLTFEPKERASLEQEKQSYGSEKAMEFHRATLKQLGLEYGVHVDNLEISDEIGVYVIVKKLTPALVREGVEVGDKIRIGLSARLSISELAVLFESRGMMANFLDDGGKFVGLLLVPKKERKQVDVDPPNLEKTHPFKKHFDGEDGRKAYNRMVAGSLELLPYLERFTKGHKMMEVGPFYDPLLTKERFPNAEITYVDRDKDVLKFLKDGGNNTKYFEFGVSKPIELVDLPEQDVIVTSHIVNHIGLPDLVQILKLKLVKGGVLFMNESIDYGGDLMHQDRPESIEHILIFLRKEGFEVLSYRIIPSINLQFQPNPRVVIAAQKI